MNGLAKDFETYKDKIGQVDHGVNHMLDHYRSENKKYRGKKAVPAYFHQKYAVKNNQGDPAVVFKNVRASYFDDPDRVDQAKKHADQITKDFHHYTEKWSVLNESFIKTNQDLQAKYD